MSDRKLPLGQATQGVNYSNIYTLIWYTTWNQNKISQHVSKSEKLFEHIVLSLEGWAGINNTENKEKVVDEGGDSLSSFYFSWKSWL